MDPKWIEFFEKLGLTTAGPILLIIVIGFFGKHLIQYFFTETIEFKKIELNKEIESFKRALNNELQKHQHDLDKLLEKNRSELNLLNTKYSRLHEKQLQIIAEIYKRIVITDRQLRELPTWISSWDDENERKRLDDAENAVNNYKSYHSENGIFFSEEINAHLENLGENFEECLSSFISNKGKVASTSKRRRSMLTRHYADYRKSSRSS